MYELDFELDCCTCVYQGTCLNLACDIPGCDEPLYDTDGAVVTISFAHKTSPEGMTYSQQQTIVGTQTSILNSIPAAVTQAMAGKYYYVVTIQTADGCIYELCSGCVFVRKAIA